MSEKKSTLLQPLTQATVDDRLMRADVVPQSDAHQSRAGSATRDPLEAPLLAGVRHLTSKSPTL